MDIKKEAVASFKHTNNKFTTLIKAKNILD